MATKKLTAVGAIALASAILGGVIACVFIFARPAKADLDPKALIYTLPDQIKWTGGDGGAQQAILEGDPSKPGLYIVLTKWTAHHNSHPHFHLVGGDRKQVRPGQHGAHASRHICEARWQADPL